jgi:hypothetical protein
MIPFLKISYSSELTPKWNAKKVNTFVNARPHIIFFRLLAVLPLNPHFVLFNVNKSEDLLHRGAILRKTLRMKLDSQLWAP